MKYCMCFVSLCILAALSATTAFGAPRHTAPNAGHITEISVERTACFGTCPVDKVTLRSDGTAIYEGYRFVERLGKLRGNFYWVQFQRLSNLLYASGFFNLKNRYDKPITDNPSIITSVVRGGQRKAVTNYADAGPVQLWGIERAILGVATDIKWQKVEPISKATGEGTSGVRGVAVAGPISPVSRIGDPPNERPLARAVITIQPDGGGKEITRKRADEQGRFEIALPPGKYLLVPLGPRASDQAPPEEPQADDLKGDAAMLPRGTSQTLIVGTGRFTDVVVDYDTGIR